MKTATRMGSAALEILCSLIDLGQITFNWAEDPHAFAQRFFGRIDREEWDKLFEESRKRGALKRLKQKQWIEHRQRGNFVEFSIQHDAALKMLQANMRQTGRPLPSGSFTVVIFDFPEAARKARAAFRRALKAAGFKQKQLSVWVSTRDVASEAWQMVQALQCGKWVSVYLAQEIEKAN